MTPGVSDARQFLMQMEVLLDTRLVNITESGRR
jgi:hypothetical protein